MGEHEYFSDRERTDESSSLRMEIGRNAWTGIEEVVRRFHVRGDFGKDFPEVCTETMAPIGTNAQAFYAALGAEVPNWRGGEELPETAIACDYIEFCYRHVSRASVARRHDFYDHDHLKFDDDQGRAEFRENINLILRRNHVALTLGENGRVVRIADDPAGHTLLQSSFNTGDAKLDSLLEEARSLYLDPRELQRALEKLWDAWERLKTIHSKDKIDGVAALLDATAPAGPIRDLLEGEAKLLTNVGNKFHIRHSEKEQYEVTDPTHADWLFQRLFALVLLTLRQNGLLK